MDNEKQKRSRGSNFSKEEELLLLTEVEKNKNIIECKMTDKINSSEKSEAWKRIVISFNSKNACHRTLEQLKIKYDNIKNKARKIAAGNKNYIGGTGGGPSKSTDLDPAIESVLRIINKKTVVGLENPFDCDREDDNEMLMNENVNMDPVPDNSTNIKILRIEKLTSDEQIPLTSSLHDSQNSNEYVKNYNEQNSAAIEEQCLTPNLTLENRAEEAHRKRKNDNWSKYTPIKLRTPMSRKLRETTNNRFKEEFYRKRTELTEEEIKKNKLEQQNLIEKKLRDIDEHQKK